ncbi:MAG: anhydro-N-acetylmuramic acid kinase, partial [Anaerolineae bacterium]
MIIIGLMSGTSADAIDAAVCEISGEPPGLNARVIRAVKVPHDAGFRARILAACNPEGIRVDELTLLNADLGDAFAQAAQIVMREARVRPSGIDLIASHGQTVWHVVDEDGRTQATLQLGEASIIAERTGVTTIDNFRSRDVAVGGQGTPLTAYADWLLLRHPTRWRAVQNIGRIGSITFLPPHCDEQTLPLAFDTGPGNVLIDSAVSLLTQGAMTHDQDGR